MDHNKDTSLHIERNIPEFQKNLDDDGRPKRTGTVLTASSHIITAVIGSGVLSLAWGVAQLGWIAGPVVLVAFSFVTYFTSTLLADCYRSPDPVTGKRNYTYMDVVRANLGKKQVILCGVAQYTNLIGVSIGYTITASLSIVSIVKTTCHRKHGGDNPECQHISSYPYMAAFGVIQLLLSQIPNFHKLSWLSIVAATMSFTYATIGVGLSIAKVVGGAHPTTSLTGTVVGVDVSAGEKLWQCFQAIGDMAFAYAYSMVLVEIQDTLKSNPPENKQMKKASLVGVTTTSLFYILCGCIGYAAFGNETAGSLLENKHLQPDWLVDIANACIVIHLVGAYQVFSQPLFGFVEKRCANRWPESSFITTEIATCGSCKLNLFKLTWRSIYVIVTIVVAMIFPFFNAFVGLLGAASFWPLTVYFPVEMTIARTKIPKFSFRWIWMKILVFACLIISAVAFAGSVEGLVDALKKYKPFHA